MSCLSPSSLTEFNMTGSLSAPLDTFNAIQERRSIKSFKPEPIPAELLRRLVELTVAAPSTQGHK
ncbi:MAG: nitroreductase family protein [Cyanobacteria bacterium P01_H01_bin.58]